MKRTNLTMLFLLGAIMLTGCFSIARYQANVRPDTVSTSPALKGKYRLERILLNTKDFSEIGAVTEKEYLDLCWMSEIFAKLDENTKKSYANQSLPEAVEQVRKLVDPTAFDAFSKRIAKERPLFRQQILEYSKKYHAALEAKDNSDMANSMAGIVGLYYGLEAAEKMAGDFKKGYAKVNDPYMPGWTMRDRFEAHAKSKYEAIKRLATDDGVRRMYLDAVRKSLLKNYPSIFTEDDNATPITVLISWDKMFEDHHSYGVLLCALGFPFTQEMETTYRVRVIPAEDKRDAEELWNEYAYSLLEYPQPPQNGGAVRQREMWTSYFVPISLIGIPGESNWPKERKCFTTGSALITKQRDEFSNVDGIYGGFGYYSPVEYMERFVFDPVCDGDVIAAMIVRCLNRIAEEKE